MATMHANLLLDDQHIRSVLHLHADSTHPLADAPLATSSACVHPTCPSQLWLQGSRTTLYRRCTHDIFAPFGECARWDGLVERLTRFADDARHVVDEVRAVPAC